MNIIYPMFALVVVTFVVGLSMGAVRLISVKKGQVNPKYYKLLTGYEAPENIIKFWRGVLSLCVLCTLLFILPITTLNTGFMLF